MGKYAFFLPLLLLVSCASKPHHDDVRPGEGGLNAVVIRHADEVAGAQEAIKQATTYCEKFDKRVAITDEESEYTGNMEERTYKRMRSASKAAKNTGASMGGVGGTVIEDLAGEGYSVTMKFRCQ